MRILHFFTALAAVASLTATTTASETLFSNGQIYTMNPALPWAEAMIIKDGVRTPQHLSNVTGLYNNGARQLGVEERIGSLEIGKAADFIILDANPLTVDNYEIHQITPTDVYLNGVSQHLSRSE